MPKMKTNRGAAKRFKLTGKGHVRRSKAYKSHILTHKSAKRKRKMAQQGLVPKVEERRIKRLLPYS